MQPLVCCTTVQMVPPTQQQYLSTFVFIIIYYAQVLRYMFRPFPGHHQASHKNINLSS
jgi:hypothetical protein